jgi:hypothetical protein
MRQAVIRLPNLTGFGKYPDLTPSSHADLLIGNSFKMVESLTKAESGRMLFCISRSVKMLIYTKQY